MTTQLTPAEVAQTDVLKRLVQVMTLRLSETGSGAYTPEVQDFQKGWNQYARIFPKMQDPIPTPSDVCYRPASTVRHFALVEDGQFGPKTSTALYYLIGPQRPPCKASGMPTWYVQNRDRINALVPPTSYPVDTSQPHFNPAAQMDNAVSELAVARAGGTDAAQLNQGPPSAPVYPESDLTGAGYVEETQQRSDQLVSSLVSEDSDMIEVSLPGAPSEKTIQVRGATARNAVDKIKAAIYELVVNSALPRDVLHITVYGENLPPPESLVDALIAETKAQRLPQLEPTVDLVVVDTAVEVAPSEIAQAEDVPVIARPRTGRVGATAAIIAGVGLAAGLGWIAYKSSQGGGRRRYA